MRRALKHIGTRLGIRIMRARPLNRFNAEAETLALLRRRGYDPRVIVDGGANVGEWARMARGIFPAARLDLVEPQSGCRAALDTLARSLPKIEVHAFAVTSPGVESVRMGGGGDDAANTGNLVLRDDETYRHTRTYPAMRLDALFANRITPADRALLKLDLEGHELAALEGASRLLDAVEVIAVELQFYEIGHNGRPVFADYVAFLGDRGFDLYDFASLSARRRDQRRRQGDILFVRRNSALATDVAWE